MILLQSSPTGVFAGFSVESDKKTMDLLGWIAGKSGDAIERTLDTGEKGDWITPIAEGWGWGCATIAVLLVVLLLALVILAEGSGAL